MNARRLSRGLSWVALAFAVSAIASALALSIANGDPSTADLSGFAAYVPPMIVSAVVGFAILHRREGHPIGWLLLANACNIALGAAVVEYATLAYSHAEPLRFGRAMILWGNFSWPLLFAPLVAIAWCFPNGHLLSRRWVVPAWIGVAAFTSVILGGLLGHEPPDKPFTHVEPVRAISDGLSQILQVAGLVGMFVAVILGAACLVIRFRRAKGVERQQVKWLALSGALLPVAITVGTLFGGPEYTWLVDGVLGLALTAIALSIGLAVMRYRLYDIDRLISTAVTYLTLTAVLAAVFGGVVLLGSLTVGRGSLVTTAAAASIVTLAFKPVRDRLQHQVDRRFNRGKYAALKRIDTFLGGVRAGQAEPEDIEGVLGESLADPQLRMFYVVPEGGYADRSGNEVDALPQATTQATTQTAVQRGSAHVATVIHAADESALNPELVESVLEHAELAIEMARLRVLGRLQLQASRRRIVATSDETRRRIERNLHDGAQQHLVALAVKVGIIKTIAQEGEPAMVGEMLDTLREDVQVTIQEVRELAHGIYPPLLRDRGLGDALRAAAGRSPLPCEVDDTLPSRYSEDVETAAYFCTLEAMQNAGKHAGDSAAITVTARHSDGQLHVAVSDTGAGFDPQTVTLSHGFVNMRDRLGALGGTLNISSTPGTGTTVEAVIPAQPLDAA